MQRACKNCKFAEKGEADPNNIGAPRPMICRRFPPTPIAVPSPQGVGISTQLPVVTERFWCYEFAAKLASAS
jgi:hypothetical protein